MFGSVGALGRVFTKAKDLMLQEADGVLLGNGFRSDQYLFQLVLLEKPEWFRADADGKIFACCSTDVFDVTLDNLSASILHFPGQPDEMHRMRAWCQKHGVFDKESMEDRRCDT
jgi:hypothetical protein